MNQSNDKHENKYKFYRKPSFKKKAPEVKQTKTSIKRMILVNPLLKCSINTENIAAPKPIVKTVKTTIPKNEPKVPIRRTLSAQHFDKKKSEKKTHSCSSASSSGITQSMDNIHTLSTAVHNMSAITETSYEENQNIFKTPTAPGRRSIFKFTPISSNSNRRSLYRSSTPLPSLMDLQKRLNDWLKKRGKSTSMFYHLKCFTPPNIEEGNKENVELNEDFDSSSYDDLRIQKGMESKTTEDSEELDKLAKAALVDLCNLIQEGYSITHCEGWLDLMKDKCHKLQDDPDYWECRAAIEQRRGNIYNAVEFYKTAIVKGAEISQVDKSLDVLLEKFSLLNISPDKSETAKSTRERARIIQDARNVFKSSIIKFAILEKKNKQEKQGVSLVAVPVRRSGRLSRSMYTSTPGVKVISSLKEIDTLERTKLNFQQNKALK